MNTAPAVVGAGCKLPGRMYSILSILSIPGLRGLGSGCLAPALPASKTLTERL